MNPMSGEHHRITRTYSTQKYSGKSRKQEKNELIVSKRRLTCDLVDSLIFDRLGSSRKVIRRESHFGSSSVRPNIDPNKTRPNRQKEYFNGADSYAVYQGSVMGNDLVESGQHQGTSSSDTPSTLQCADDSGHVTSGLLGCYGAGQKGTSCRHGTD